MGRSALRLSYNISSWDAFHFQDYQKILLSTNDLVVLSTLTRLEQLSLRFESPLSRPVRETRRLHPPTRSTLLALTYFWFEGVSEYLEDLVAQINVPLLDYLNITFFHQPIFDTPQLAQFLARTLNFQSLVEAHTVSYDGHVVVIFPQTFLRGPLLEVRCKQSDWQLSSLAQVSSSSFPQVLIRMVELLHISETE